MPTGPKIRGPLLLMVAGIICGLILSFGYTTWAIGYHSRQACAELRIMATAKGATGSYETAVRREYQHLYALRCP
jgi:hypothetical protein